MIYEKGLIKAMKDEYRTRGYSVADDGNGRLWIVADTWFAGIWKQNVSNDVKSVIVLHFGRMPEENGAMNVHKGEDPNAELMDNVLAVPDMLITADPEGKFRVTPVRLGDRVMFQDDLFNVRLARETDVLPMRFINLAMLANGWLTQEDGESFIGALSCHGFEDEAGKVALLEQMDWR